MPKPQNLSPYQVSIPIRLSGVLRWEDRELAELIGDKMSGTYGAAGDKRLADWFRKLPTEAQASFFNLDEKPKPQPKAASSAAKKKPAAKPNGAKTPAPRKAAKKTPPLKSTDLSGPSHRSSSPTSKHTKGADLHVRMLELLKQKPHGLMAVYLERDLPATAGQVKGLLKRAMDAGSVRSERASTGVTLYFAVTGAKSVRGADEEQ
jgi:hypothetical protein